MHKTNEELIQRIFHELADLKRRVAALEGNTVKTLNNPTTESGGGGGEGELP